MADLSGNNINGTQDDDNILGTTGDDTLRGNDGNDVITPDEGDDTVEGGLGNDTVNFGSTTVNGTAYGGATQAVDVSLNDGRAYNDGHGNQDTITGVENVIGSTLNDTIEGDAVDNVIEGGTGQDDLKGLGGDDTFVQSGAEGDQIDGGDNSSGIGDKIDYSRTLNTVNLNIDLTTGIVSDGVNTMLDDSIAGIENVVTGKGSDTITLVDGERNIVTHTTNVAANGSATGTSGNGGDDTVINFQIGNNNNSDGTDNLAATFDIIDLSHVIIPQAGNRADYITVSQVSGSLVIDISASGNVSMAGYVDKTSVTLNNLSFSDLISSYSLAAGSIVNSTQAIDAMLSNRNLLIGTDAGTPSVELPQEHSVNENATVVFDGVNEINVNDLLADNSANLLDQVTVVVEVRDAANPEGAAGDGVLTLGGRVPNALIDGVVATGQASGDGTGKITLIGTVPEINQALTDLQFTAINGNNSEDQLLRVTITDNNGLNATRDVELIVNANVEQAASLSVTSTEIFQPVGVTFAALNIGLTLPTDSVATTGVNEGVDTDSSESTVVDIVGVPSTATLSSAGATGAVTTYTSGTETVYRISGTAAEVAAALSDLRINNLTNSDYPVTLTATAITTDVDAEGVNATLSSNSVSLTIDGLSADISAVVGEQAVGTANHEQIFGVDAQADQLIGGAGRDILNGATSGGSDDSDRDLAYYAKTDSNASTITAGVDVNLTTNEGRGGHAEGDTYLNIEGAMGTTFDDRFTGVTNERNYFWGNTGNDIFVADLATDRSQDDIFAGADGSDTLSLENLGIGATVDLTQSSQDFNVDAVRDARLASIENVISGSGNDTITLKNSTQTTISGATSGNVNGNSVIVNRVDSGNDTITNFDVANDKLDLTGVLDTGMLADLNSYVTVAEDTSGNTVISIDKDKSGTAEATVTLTGITGQGWTNAAVMATAGVLVHDLTTTLASVTDVENTANVVGARDQVTFYVNGASQGLAPVTNQVIVVEVGKSQYSYTVQPTDTTWDTVATNVATGINAASNLDSISAVVDSSDTTLVKIQFESLVNVTTTDVTATYNGVTIPVGVVQGPLTTTVSTADLNAIAYTAVPVTDYNGATLAITADGTNYTQAIAGSTLATSDLNALATTYNAGETNTYLRVNAGNTVSVLAGESVDINGSVDSLVTAGGGDMDSIVVKMTIDGFTYYGADYDAAGANKADALADMFTQITADATNRAFVVEYDSSSELFRVYGATSVSDVSFGGFYNNTVATGNSFNSVLFQDATTSSAGPAFVVGDVSGVNARLTAGGAANSWTATGTVLNDSADLLVKSFNTTQLNGAMHTSTDINDRTVVRVDINSNAYHGVGAENLNSARPHEALTDLATRINANTVLSTAGVTATFDASTGHFTLTGVAAADVSQIGFGVLRSGTDQTLRHDNGGWGTADESALNTIIADSDYNIASRYNEEAAGQSGFNIAEAETELLSAGDFAAITQTRASMSATSVSASLTEQTAVQNAQVSSATEVAEVHTVTLAGDVDAGAVYSVTVNGQTFSTTATATDTLTTLRDKLVTAINADTRGVAAVTELTLNPETNWKSGDVYSVTVNGTTHSYTVQSGQTLEDIRDGILNAINGITSKQTYQIEVTAVGDPGDKISVTLASTAFEYTVKSGDDAAAVYDGLRSLINAGAPALNVTTSLNASGQLVVTHHGNSDISTSTTTAGSGTANVTATPNAGVFTTAPVSGVSAAIGDSLDVVVITSTDAELVVTSSYTDSGLSPVVAADTSNVDVDVVNGFSVNTDALADAVSSGSDALTITSSAAGYDLTVSAGVAAAVVNVLEGQQYFYGNNGIVDNFVWRDDAIDGNDSIEGFNIGEDSLDLSDVLSGTSTSLSDYITVADAGAGNNVVLSIDADGAASTTTDKFDITLVASGTGAVDLTSLVDDGTLLKPETLS